MWPCIVGRLDGRTQQVKKYRDFLFVIQLQQQDVPSFLILLILVCGCSVILLGPSVWIVIYGSENSL